MNRALALACELTVAAAATCVHAAGDCGAALKTKQAWLAEGDGVQVAFVARPMPVPLGRHFTIDFAICDGGVARSASGVSVDADMPAHRHGMNYRASVSQLGDGTYRAQGLMFHMPGTWRVIFDLGLDGRAVRVTRAIEVQ
jgi:hypothetical protein